MPSFDIVSEPNEHEVDNAFDQTVREITQRFDFQGTGASILRIEKGFELKANSPDKVKAIYDVLIDKFVKRKLSLKFLEAGESMPAGGTTWQMSTSLKKGVDQENAKKIAAFIKADKQLKVTPSIQGESVRITGKKKDDLQSVMNALRAHTWPLELSFTNFRD